jgi:hypothetical protein
MMPLRRYFLVLAPLLALVSLAAGQTPDLRTPETAITTTVAKGSANAGGQTGYLGVALVRDKEGRVTVEDVQPDSPGAKAGINNGDQVTKLGDRDVGSPLAFREWLQTYAPGDTVKVTVMRDGKPVELTATLAATSRPMGKGGPGGGKGGPALTLWTKPVFRVAVVGVEFPDVKHNEKVAAKDWEAALLSSGEHNGKNATGQAVHGSLNDYFLEQSASKFHLEGKFVGWVDVGKKRADYAPGNGTNNRTAVLLDALAKLQAQNKDALKDVDGCIFLFAGEVPGKVNQGNVYYPHAGALTHDNKRYPYLFTAEGGSKMTPVSGFAKLGALMLGLPDLAAKPEQAGFRGLGAWCVLSSPLGDGRPQHLSAWAKEKLGWIQPAVIDPTVKQKLVLAPIEDSPKECFKILVRPNGSEYYLVENRRKKGFDADLPGEGLLIWRVLNDRPTLIESHGNDGPTGPVSHLTAIPWPSDANSSFTPDTVPSSKSPLGGGLPVHLTEIRRLPDGRISFSIGYEFK